MAVLLSGGLESTLLVAVLADSYRGPLTTFSIGFDSSGGVPGDQFEEERRVARRFGTSHHCLHVPTADLIEALTGAVADMSEPTASHDALALHLLAHQVADHTHTVISGHGASHVLDRHRRHPGTTLQGVGEALDMTRAWGVDAMAPFLDRRLVTLAAHAPLAGADADTVLGWLARDLLREGVARRPTGLPLLPALMRLDGPVLALIRDTLSSPQIRSRGLLRPHTLGTMLTAPTLTAPPPGVSALWKVTVLEMWLQHHHIDATTSAAQPTGDHQKGESSEG